MLIDVRTYRCRPGTINTHLALCERYGKEPQFRCLGSPLAYLKEETGDPNEYVNIWLFENAGDQEAKRTKLYADKKWLAYLKKIADLGAIESQINKLTVPKQFCPLGGRV